MTDRSGTGSGVPPGTAGTGDTSPPAAGGQHPLTSNGFFAQDPAWWPDGTQLAFKSNRGGDGDAIWVVAAGGGQPWELPRRDSAGDQAPAWGNR